MSCALGYQAGIAQCSKCKWRTPLVAISLPIAEPQRMRGLGDLIHRLVRILFIGRADLAERLAGRVEALWSRRRREVSVSLPTTPRRPCGCKGRQQRLNGLLPFRK
jgi:hypothetical protein